MTDHIAFADELRQHRFDQYIKKLETIALKSQQQKPTLGLCPQYIWQAKRHEDVCAWLVQRIKTNDPIYAIWVDEYNEYVTSKKEKLHMGRKDIIDVYGTTKAETDLASLFDDGTLEVWIPKSQCEEWPAVGEEGELLLPEWLAQDKELI